MDTEADSLHAYPAKLCLVQIRVEEGNWLIDPLAGLELKGLFESLKDKTLILHAADYDLRLLYQYYQFSPARIFDTMIGARLAGIEKLGLSDLCRHFFDVQLSKSNQKANWAKRPLSESMEVYARNDTLYLKGIADRLEKLLKEQGRLEWHEQWCEALIRDAIIAVQRPESEDSWRIKGSAALSVRELAFLKTLWAWREKEAVRRNKPPFFVLSHSSLINLAKRAAAGESLTGNPVSPLSYRSLEEMQQLVNETQKKGSHHWPKKIKYHSTRLTEIETSKMKHLFRIRDKAARELDMDPTLIASKTTLINLSREGCCPEDHLLPWQMDLLRIKQT